MSASRRRALPALSLFLLLAGCGDGPSSSGSSTSSGGGGSGGTTTSTSSGGAGGTSMTGGSGGSTGGTGGSAGTTTSGGTGGAAPCMNDGECDAGSFCSGGSCVPKLGPGEPCSGVNACLSGFCVDGVCCDSVCDEPCAACDVSGSAGTCSPSPAGSPSDAGACIPYVCDGTLTGCPASCMTIEDCVGQCSQANSECTPPTGAHLWSKRFGDAKFQVPESMVVDGGGNLTIAGYFSGTVDFGGGVLSSAGGDDVFVVRLDPSGNHVWSQRYGDVQGDQGKGVGVDPQGNVYVAGTFRGTVDFGVGPLTSSGAQDVFVLKLGPSGTPLWSKRFGSSGASDGVKAIAVTPAGVFFAGEHSTGIDFGGGTLNPVGEFDVYVVSLDTNGAHLWSKSFGGVGSDGVTALVAAPDGGCALTGMFIDSIDFGGGALPSVEYDVYVARLTASGDHVWSKRFGGAGLQEGRALAFDPQGALFVSGDNEGSIDLGGGVLATAGQADVFLAKLDENGNTLWGKAFGDPGLQLPWSVAADSGGNVILAGSMEGTVDFGTGPLTSTGGFDAFLAKFDPSGVPLWSRRYADNLIRNVGVDGSRRIYLSAPLFGSTDFGGGVLVANGNTDVVAAKLQP